VNYLVLPGAKIPHDNTTTTRLVKSGVNEDGRIIFGGRRTETERIKDVGEIKGLHNDHERRPDAHHATF
jgi:hypothetical protein